LKLTEDASEQDTKLIKYIGEPNYPIYAHQQFLPLLHQELLILHTETGFSPLHSFSYCGGFTYTCKIVD
jgi:hypothetical protein